MPQMHSADDVFRGWGAVNSINGTNKLPLAVQEENWINDPAFRDSHIHLVVQKTTTEVF